jgi:Predicted ICC-like phosphoesterases
MTGDQQFDSVPDGRSVIVVSDLHLGLIDQETVNKDFLEFLKYLGNIPINGASSEKRTLIIDGKPRELYAPDKIILLGDIVDLWSPRKDIRSSVLEDAFPLILATLTSPAKVVYIAGNHDGEIAEIEGSFPQGPHTQIKIIKDHYPDTSVYSQGKTQYTGQKIGSSTYFFLHGHQFDLTFKTVGILQDYPGWVSKNYALFKEFPMLKWGIRGICVISLAYILAAAIKIAAFPFTELVYFVFGLSLILSLFTIEPTSFRALWDFMSQRIKTKTATIETIIEEGFWNPIDGNNILADVVVFGHTHVADDSKERYLKKYHKRFINSGSWGEKNTVTSGNPKCKANTFVYIDENGPILFYWPHGGVEPVHINRTLTGDIKKIKEPSMAFSDRFRRWRRKHFWTRA